MVCTIRCGGLLPLLCTRVGALLCSLLCSLLRSLWRSRRCLMTRPRPRPRPRAWCGWPPPLGRFLMLLGQGDLSARGRLSHMKAAGHDSTPEGTG